MGDSEAKKAIDKIYNVISQTTEEYVFIGDMRLGTFRYPSQMVEEFGLPGEIVEDAMEMWCAKIHEKDRNLFRQSMEDLLSGKTSYRDIQYRAQNVSGEWVWLRCRGSMMEDENGERNIYTGTITNMSHYDRTDQVTGLRNRFEAEHRVEQMLGTEETPSLGVLVLGFDNFRRVNDFYNRAFGDKVIRRAARQIQNLLPQSALLYRFDGDEFLIIFKDCSTGQVYSLYHDLQELYTMPQEIDGNRYEVTLSGGYAQYPRDGKGFQELVKRAVYCLEFAKAEGKNRIVLFSNKVMEIKERKLELTEELREHIEDGFAGFEVYYQPLRSAVEEKIVGAEALMRFSCERFGRVAPVEFIPLLEEDGMIGRAGEWVFETSVNMAREMERLIPGFTMHINVSWIQFERYDFLSYLVQKKREGFWEGCNIVLELTESSISSNYSQIKDVLHALHELGFKVAMDDFGTGYSSLGLLKSVPVNIVKIDRSFIVNMQESVFDVTFVEFIVKLCHAMGISVCQEGIESREQEEELKDKELELYQGFYFGKPMDREKFISLCKGDSPEDEV